MKKFTFAVLFLCMGAIASAQQVTLLEGDTGGPAKSASSSDDGMPQVIVPKEEAPAAVPASTAPAAAAPVKKPAKKIINKKKGKAAVAVAVSSSAVKSPEAAPAVSPAPARPAAEAVKAVEKSTAPAAFPFEAVKPEELPAAALAGKTPVQAKPAEAAKPAAEVKPAAAAPAAPAAVPAAKPAETVKPAAKPAAEVKPAAAAVVKPAAVKAVKPAETVKPAAKPAAPRPEVVQAPPAAAGAGFSVAKTHTVTGGDTLWDLSNKYYKDPYRWGKIYNANLGTVKNPDRIYPKEELVIPDLTEEVKPGAAKKTVITGGETVKEAEFTGSDVAQPEETSAQTSAAAPAKAAPAELGEILKEFDANDLSEEMPEHQKEWSAGVKIVPESWQQDGVVSAAEKGEGEQMENSLSETGDVVLVSLNGAVAVKTGDYLSVYMKGAAAYDKAGKKLGLELQQAGTLQVLGADGPKVRARVIEALTAISKGYVVKKK